MKIWQKSVDFTDRILEMAENLNTGISQYRIAEQIESAVVTVSNNIAEGKKGTVV